MRHLRWFIIEMRSCLKYGTSFTQAVRDAWFWAPRDARAEETIKANKAGDWSFHVFCSAPDCENAARSWEHLTTQEKDETRERFQGRPLFCDEHRQEMAEEISRMG